MATLFAPDVYIQEISVFPPSVAEVATAIPAFIGFTEKALAPSEGDLTKKPFRIKSFVEFEQFYGFPSADAVTVDVVMRKDPAGLQVTVHMPQPTYLLYWAVKHYFDNGGGPCYVVSVGGYDKALVAGTELPANADKALEDGLDAIALEDEPTLLVVPEAVKLGLAKYGSVVQKALAQCGLLKDRFAILDVHPEGVAKSREQFVSDALRYGAAYHPFLRTKFTCFISPKKDNVKVTFDGFEGDAKTKNLSEDRAKNTEVYAAVEKALSETWIVLPPSGAVAGVFAATDRTRGVWKAPANVGLAGVIEPLERFTSEELGGFNVDPNGGRSINALRAFSGKGTLVWGARTLAGNDNEWRYVPVRRFFNMVEESVKKATYQFVFEPNDANTWVKVRGMVENYLVDKWREGALAGATPKEAFYVRCGLGTTMTAQDILEGHLNVEVGMAAVRPAEFIVVKFAHKMQTS